MKEKIVAIITKVKEDQSLGEIITDNTDLVNDIGFDSLQMINFLLTLEDELDLELDFDKLDYEHLKVFKNLVEYVNECKKAI